MNLDTKIKTLKPCTYSADVQGDYPQKIIKSPNNVSKYAYAAQLLIAVSLAVS
jgi:hypothetical protein